MNINQNINKLLYALKQKEKFYKTNSFKFYSEKNDKYCTKYQVLKRETILKWNKETEEFENKEKYKVDFDCYSKIELMQYLADELKGSEVDGR